MSATSVRFYFFGDYSMIGLEFLIRILVALVFGIATIGTMMLVVSLGYHGVSLIRFKGKEHQIHLLAGLVILLAGAGMQFLGL